MVYGLGSLNVRGLVYPASGVCDMIAMDFLGFDDIIASKSIFTVFIVNGYGRPTLLFPDLVFLLFYGLAKNLFCALVPYPINDFIFYCFLVTCLYCWELWEFPTIMFEVLNLLIT